MEEIGIIGLTCPHCGGDTFAVSDDPTDDSVIVCHGCGNDVCTVGEYRQTAIKKARTVIPDIVERLKPRKN